MRATSKTAARALLLAALALAACSPPPRGTTTDPSRPLPAPPSDEAAPAPTKAPYDFEREGKFPAPASDVAFEEDQLPPRPEEVGATPLDATDVRSDDVAEPEPESATIQPSVPTPAPPSVKTPVPEEPRAMRMGFRVQLIAAADRVEAEGFAREARSRLAVPVYVEFEAPYYKVRAGDFTDRADALALRDRAKAVGYEGAWVTSARIMDSSDSGS